MGQNRHFTPGQKAPNNGVYIEIGETGSNVNTKTKQMGKFMIISGFTLLITLTCIGLQGYHAEPRCKVPGVSGCPEMIKTGCPQAPAVRFSAGGTSYACDWRTATSVVGLLGLVVTLIFLCAVILMLRGKDLKSQTKVLAVIAVPLLLATIGLMIADLVKGSDATKGSNGAKHDSYIANVILTLIAVIFVAFLAMKAKNE